MSRPQSRTRRKAAFMAEAERMYEQLEEWYDQHPQASFGELEATFGIQFSLVRLAVSDNSQRSGSMLAGTVGNTGFSGNLT